MTGCGWNLDTELPASQGACGKPAQNVIPLNSPRAPRGQVVVCDSHLELARAWVADNYPAAPPATPAPAGVNVWVSGHGC